MNTETASNGTPTSPDGLEREIERTRDELVGTVDAIVERVHPKEVADRNAEQLKRDAQRALDTAQERAEELQDRASTFVEEHPDRAKNYAIGAGLFLAVLLLRRRRRRRAAS
ncbi:DUF3618 domain-containing protein [Euzebya rosea]|uniref:DUF3618 domain-containing protein n=1 Tax=Euzebya rosea TaxID=2052804 RepID=UPI000D3E7237|nr:DUF3618 domain-containing protein [Euzebya rosea]